MPTGRGFTVLGGVAAAALIALTTSNALHRSTPARPSHETIALVSTPAAPNAHGNLVFDPAVSQAVLTVSGLPKPNAITGHDSVYEVWLIRADGAAVPAAYLSQAPDGTWTAAMHGDMRGITTVATTVEPPGGSITPSGTKVMQGYLPTSTAGAGSA